MHGGYGINKLNEEAVRHHEATVKLNAEHAQKVAANAAERDGINGAGSGDVSQDRHPAPALA